MCIKINKVGKQEVGIWWVQKRFPRYGVPIWSLWPNIRFLPSTVTEKNATKNILDERKDGRTDGRTDRRTEVKQYTPSPFGEQGYKNKMVATEYLTLILLDNNGCRCCWLCPLNDAKHPGKIVDPASLEQV
jgi:hypothetical protein